jgi:hypothetical protein
MITLLVILSNGGLISDCNFFIPDINTVARAGGYAGRLQTPIQPCHTQVAFLGKLLHIVKLHRPKGATFDTFLAAITKLFVNDSNAILSGAYSIYRADSLTRSGATL